MVPSAQLATSTSSIHLHWTGDFHRSRDAGHGAMGHQAPDPGSKATIDQKSNMDSSEKCGALWTCWRPLHHQGFSYTGQQCRTRVSLFNSSSMIPRSHWIDQAYGFRLPSAWTSRLRCPLRNERFTIQFIFSRLPSKPGLRKRTPSTARSSGPDSRVPDSPCRCASHIMRLLY